MVRTVCPDHHDKPGSPIKVFIKGPFKTLPLIHIVMIRPNHARI